MSFVLMSYGCLKDVFCMLWILKDVFRILWMSNRRLLYIMDVLNMSSVRLGCLKDVFCTLWMS